MHLLIFGQLLLVPDTEAGAPGSPGQGPGREGSRRKATCAKPQPGRAGSGQAMARAAGLPDMPAVWKGGWPGEGRVALPSSRRQVEVVLGWGLGGHQA